MVVCARRRVTDSFTLDRAKPRLMGVCAISERPAPRNPQAFGSGSLEFKKIRFKSCGSLVDGGAFGKPLNAGCHPVEKIFL